jgi:3-phenylpropionate/trans-cinnamate dioxygenase ferredoxin subunit
VATVDEIPPGGRKIVEVGGRSIGVFNLSGEFFALRNNCPHEGGPLCVGPICGLVSSERPGEYEYSRQGEIVRCPWHGWEFDIRTGQSWFDPRKVRVRRYEVTVEAGATTGATTATTTGLQRGPYVAETYDVSVEQQHIIVEIPG